jgi:hypothetical protein
VSHLTPVVHRFNGEHKWTARLLDSLLTCHYHQNSSILKQRGAPFLQIHCPQLPPILSPLKKIMIIRSTISLQ